MLLKSCLYSNLTKTSKVGIYQTRGIVNLRTIKTIQTPQNLFSIDMFPAHILSLHKAQVSLIKTNINICCGKLNWLAVSVRQHAQYYYLGTCTPEWLQP